MASYAPMLLQSCKELPRGEQWLYEIKWDGYRAIAHAHGANLVRLTSRNKHDLTQRFPEIAAALGRALAGLDVVLDGEICCLDERGAASFSRLQQSAGPLVYYAFDLLEENGETLIGRPLAERRGRLEQILPASERLRLSQSFADGDAVLSFVQEQELEGIVAKDIRSTYRPGTRSPRWQKLKLVRHGQFLVAGIAPGKLSSGFGALVLAEQREDGLHWVGNVGTGFSGAELRRILPLLKVQARESCPFERKPRSSRLRSGVIWLEPFHRCEVEFSEWTHEGQLRQPAYKALFPR